MDRVHDSVFGRRGVAPSVGVFPALNISEDHDSLYVRAELPGIAPDELEISTKENSLIILGERKILAEGEKVSYHRKERESGRFRRIVALPAPVDAEKVTAQCKDGILTVTLPKAAEAKPRQIEVKS
jgi:HSP20 family protein